MLVFRREDLLRRGEKVNLNSLEERLREVAEEASLTFEVESEVDLAEQCLLNSEAHIQVLVILTPSLTVAEQLSRVDRKIFSIVLNDRLASSPKERLETFMKGVRMITTEVAAVRKVTKQIGSWGQSRRKRYECPKCHVKALDEQELRRHYFSYHCTESPIKVPCPICKYEPKRRELGIAVHLHNAHGPVSEREPALAKFAAFSWIIIVHPTTQKVLLINEPAPICDNIPKYWFPGELAVALTEIFSVLVNVEECI